MSEASQCFANSQCFAEKDASRPYWSAGWIGARGLAVSGGKPQARRTHLHSHLLDCAVFPCFDAVRRSFVALVHLDRNPRSRRFYRTVAKILVLGRRPRLILNERPILGLVDRRIALTNTDYVLPPSRTRSASAASASRLSS